MKKLVVPTWFFIIIIVLNVIILVAGSGIVVWARWINSVNEICVYNETDFYGIEVPEEVGLVFTKELYGDSGDRSKSGEYFKSNMKVRVQLPRRNIMQIQFSLKHEFSHHEYNYNLSSQRKERIELVYDIFCQNPSEFYAYTVEHYGEFKW